MAFKEVTDLSTETTISLGGINKKTGKPNPKQIEGYFIGKKEVEDRKKKSGKTFIYVIQTAKGNVGVWGKTDLDRKMLAVTLGHMIRITQNKMVPTPNGDMYGFKVEVDAENTTEVTAAPENSSQDHSTSFAEDDDTSTHTFEQVSDEPEAELDQDEALDEVPPVRAFPPRKSTTSPDAARVQALLNKARNKSA